MNMSRLRRARPFAVASCLAACLCLGAVRAGAQAHPDETPAATEAHRALRKFLMADHGPHRDANPAWLRDLCKLWLTYARAAGAPEKPDDFLTLFLETPAERRRQPDPWVGIAAGTLVRVNYTCPPIAGAAGDAHGVTPAATAKPKGGSRKIVLIGGAAAAAGAAVALAAGGDSASTAPPPAAAPPDVTPFHGLYVGRLDTGGPSIAGCGRAATAPCNAQVGGSSAGTPASLTFGGDLPSTGVLRPDGVMENFRYEGPAHGLAGLGDGVIVLVQRGMISGRTLTLDGTATVVSPGPCNGAVITTRVEATKN